MFGAIPLQSSDSRIILQQLLQFKRDHTIFDAGFRPPAFRRDFPSQFEPSKAIPITLKRKKNEKTDGEQPNKRAKQTKKEAAARKKKYGREDEVGVLDMAREEGNGPHAIGTTNEQNTYSVNPRSQAKPSKPAPPNSNSTKGGKPVCQAGPKALIELIHCWKNKARIRATQGIRDIHVLHAPLVANITSLSVARRGPTSLSGTRDIVQRPQPAPVHNEASKIKRWAEARCVWAFGVNLGI
ncbi:hypothetical protein C8R44DRAFT_732709 [Mycena epipterygia]|nr:hypothetical protein C8R44DRAFT_732709 [Mycena epipterygia]